MQSTLMYDSVFHALSCAFRGVEIKSPLSISSKTVQDMGVLGKRVQTFRHKPPAPYDEDIQHEWTRNLIDELGGKHCSIIKARWGHDLKACIVVSKELCRHIKYPEEKHLLLNECVLRWCKISRVHYRDMAMEHNVSTRTLRRVRSGYNGDHSIDYLMKRWRDEAVLLFEDVLMKNGLL